MLDIKYIRDHAKEIKDNTVHRRVKVDIDLLLELDEKRRNLVTEIEGLRAQRKKQSKGKPTDEEIKMLQELGTQISKLEEDLQNIEDDYHQLLMQVPNLTHPNVPMGGEEDFIVLETHGSPSHFSFDAKDHETLMVERDLIDFERGAKVVGSKFYYFKNDAVRLNQALINYGMDVVVSHGFTLMETPDLAKNKVIEGLGYNPRGEEKQMYNIADTDLTLIGTAEVTVGGYHMDEVLDLSLGPKKYAALSHCFRTEAGSYGRTSKGLYRVHQFTKLEMFIYCKPEASEDLHSELLTIEKEICDGLEIPYRVIDIASGDLGGPAYRKFDIEAWMHMNNDYGEITSTSNCTDYQARRLNIRFKDDDGKLQFVHTLNGTAVVLSRFPLAFIEHHQQEDGSINIPEALQPYLGKKQI